ncbi:MAG TPA: 6-phosphogluconolactonase [Luteibacter sp.]|nr:6-phosphogluconolactonase [Luteibacter sp.]
MNANVRENTFEDRLSLADALAHRLAADLAAGIAERGRAVLAVSGGSTPKTVFAVLARATIDWSKVTVTLVDERWVPESDERSNARIVRNLLLKQNAEAATFVPLYVDAPTPDEGLATVTASIDKLERPFDAVVLGMGGDGHTASFFPGGDHLAEALDLAGKASVLPMRAEGAGEPRITLSLPRLLDTRALYLHIEGDDKKAVLAKALAGGEYPIGAVLRQDGTEVQVYWAP